MAAFERGRRVALRRFTPAMGLGPELNVTFCVSCHERPVPGGSASHYRDFLLVGEQATADTIIMRGQNGVQRQFSLQSGRAPSDPLTDVRATRNPIPFFGAGLLAEIPSTEILQLADPDDADGDGISGRPNFDGSLVGRFGRKAQTARIELFIRGPMFNHMGVTSDPLSAERRAELPGFEGPNVFTTMPAKGRTGAIVAAQAVIPDEPTVDLDDVPDPEISEADLFDLVSFAMLLAAPEPDPPTPKTERGKETFEEVGCGKCHRPVLRGPRGAIPAYTDLLLHDMGADLADGFPMGRATGREFRTHPLWGVAAASPYLHDGRASTLDEAIRWHGGEASSVRDAYVALDDGARDDLIAFIESLGGKGQRSPGLLPPGAEVPAFGRYGAPLAGLDPAQRSLFEQGRASFDRDFAFSNGVGPRFNGDACRSCHFDPVIGGAGPTGVDVIRQGAFSGSTFVEPSSGTALPRQATAAERPEPDPEASFFEPRQTPTTLGLGLLEQIPRATIEALADPNDENADGIAGRTHVLDDGRLGRFGWKASIPSIREFVRDALSTELGMTVPSEPGLSFGVAEDEDGVSDPESDTSTIDALTAFIALLAPPPRNRTDPATEDRGEQIFTSLGCEGCHVPVLQTADGADVEAYTDLLLHDVASQSSLGIEDGQAGIHDFRTPPLWGIGQTAPYFHDGRAATLEEAIEAHEGEAAAARSRFTALSASEKEALLAFLRSL
ncbi:MAG: di-heme oxidoredictase family protein [Myxococcales bacterium]